MEITANKRLVPKGKETNVSTVFAGEKLGTFWKSNQREYVWQLKQLPIQKNTKEKRIKYLQNINDATEIITEFTQPEEWERTTKE